MHALAQVALAGTVVGVLFQPVAVAAVWRACRRRRCDSGPGTEAVTILKPLKGAGPELYENLASFCRQDHPSYQIVFGVDDADDPAVATVERLRRAFPDRDLVLAVGHVAGPNRKVANLVQMMHAARHDVLAVSDADIRVPPDYLAAQMAPLADPAVGLTTCLYRGRPRRGLPALVEALCIATDFVPNLCVTNLAKTFALGASITIRRAALERIGGFAALVDHLADDNLLGERVAAAGWRLRMVPYVVETTIPETTLADTWRHQLRWARTYRACQPVGWFASIVTHVTLWSLLAVVASRGATAEWLAAGLGVRLAASAGNLALLGDPHPLRRMWLVPVKDVLASAVWAASWFGRHVTWGERRYRLARDGRLTEVSPAAVVLDRAPRVAQ